MSEFSDSFHFHESSEEALTDLLIAARATGLILPKKGPYVTTLVPHSDWRKVIGQNRALLVVYEFAADHEARLTLYDGGTELARIVQNFETKTVTFVPDVWVERRVLTSDEVEHVRANLKTLRPPRKDRYWLMSVFHLNDCNWLSGEDLTKRKEEIRARFPDARFVRDGAPASWEAVEHDYRADWEKRKAEQEKIRGETPVGGPPLLTLLPKPKLPPVWKGEGLFGISLHIGNIGGAARGLGIEVRSELITTDAVRLDSLRVGSSERTFVRANASTWKVACPEMDLPAGWNPDLPKSAIELELALRLSALRASADLFFVRLIPGVSSSEGRGVLAIGKRMEVQPS